MSFPKHFSGDDELRDLTQEDARELRAFQEKRRWFEGKLKLMGQLLEDISPTYPFVLPDLVASEADPSCFSYANEATSAHRLPSADTLRAWQAERDALEEEVLAFDGGDLGRMKEKTREVTLVPLTKPSTHLVAITLDLILLIDRLLTLLRRRSDLLELIGLRVQWDGLRWKVMLDCGALKEDVKAYVENEGRWTVPEDGVTEETEERGTVTPSKRGEPTTTPRKKASMLDAPIASQTNSPSTGPPRTLTSSSSIFSPHSFPSPGAKSHSQSLSARHRTLVSTHLKRSSAVLDRMIDIAGPLKGLGGLHGPSAEVEEGKDGGALPDELLDMQDDLESLCEDVKKRVGLCEDLDEQREQADTYHSAVARSRAQAERVIIQLREALSEPATRAQHQLLADLLRQAGSSLPAPLDKSFPRPKHPDYPDVERHTVEIIRSLSSARAEANDQNATSTDGVKWYGRLAATYDRLDDEHATLTPLFVDFHSAWAQLRILQRHGAAAAAPGLEAYLAGAPAQIAALETQIPVLERQLQMLELASTGYGSALQIPTSLRQAVGKAEDTDGIHAGSEGRMADIRGHIRNGKEDIMRAKQDMAVLPVLQQYEGGIGELESELAELRSELAGKVDAVAWREGGDGGGEAVSSIEGLRRSMEGLEGRLQAVVRAKKELESLEEKGGKEDAGQARDERMAKVSREMREARELADLLERVAEQSKVVRQAEEEAEALLGRLGAFASGQGGLEEGLGQPTRPAEMEREVRSWLDGLADRVLFVSASGTLVASHTSAVGNVGGGAPVPTAAHSTALPALDQAVRTHLNELSLRVSSALTDLLRQLETSQTSSGNDLAGQPTASTASPPSSGLLTPEEDEDVFGSRQPHLQSTTSAATLRHPSSSSDLSSPLSQIRQLRKQVRSLGLPDLVFPSGAAMARTPSLQRLPTAETVGAISLVLAEVEKQAEALPRPAGAGEGADEEVKAARKLKEELGTARAFLPRLEALAAFSSRSGDCDEVFGRLMNLLDAGESGAPESNSEDDLAQAKAVLMAAEEASAAVESDKRVISELKRLRAIWADLSTSLGHSQADDTGSVVSSDTHISTPSVPVSPYVSRIPILTSKPRFGSSLSIRSTLSGTSTGTRSTSNPFPRLAATTESYRNRTVSSSGDGARRRAGSSSSSKSGISAAGSGLTPRVASGSGLRGSTNGASATPSRIPRLSVMSPSSAAGGSSRLTPVQGGETRTRKSSMPIPLGSVKGKERDTENARLRINEDKAYVSDPKSTLDQAVGKIVNKLRMSVPIVPVNIAGADEWKDQSGRYWIGAHGRAKLCFCRILRSRTVMVRVGGGWMELSRFLMDHFADALWTAPPDENGATALPPMTPMRKASSNALTSGPAIDPSAATPYVSDRPATVHAKPVDTTPTSTTPHATLPANSPITSDNSPTTPIRRPLIPQGNSGSRGRPRSSLPLSRSSSFFSPLQSPHTPSSMAGERSVSGSGSGPPTPLVPLHFLKKASESPPVREREKERLGAGRRSILGKEG